MIGLVPQHRHGRLSRISCLSAHCWGRVLNVGGGAGSPAVLLGTLDLMARQKLPHHGTNTAPRNVLVVPPPLSGFKHYSRGVSG